MGKMNESKLITFEGLRKAVALSGKTARGISLEIGKSEGWIRDVLAGRHSVDTEKLAVLCKYFRCSPDNLVEFHGYEVDEMYRDFRFEVPENVEGLVTYRPLMELFYDTYTERGEDWKIKLREFFDGVESSYAEYLTEGSRENSRKLIEMNRRNGSGKYPPGSSGASRPGLKKTIRADIRADRNVRIQRIYDICRKLRCPIGRVMGCK